MSEFPEEVKDLKHLKELRLIHNRIQKVPQSFYTSNPHNPLEIFIINNNPLQELDSQVRYLSKLKVLGVASTEITKLPPQIIQLKNL